MRHTISTGLRAGGWADLYLWQVDHASGTALHRQIYLQCRAAILSRALRPGTRLPSSRQLATRLGVARASVVSAYEQLLAEGYVFGRIGSGTYISSDLPEPIERGRPSRREAPAPPARNRPLSVRAPAFQDLVHTTASHSDSRPFDLGRVRLDARTVAIWRKLTHRAVRALGEIHLGYSDARGLVELRAAIGDYLSAARAVRCDPDQIIVTAGTQHAIDLAIRVLLEPEDEVWVEDPGYPLTYTALVAAKLRVRPVPVDAQGLNVTAGIRSAPRARAAFVTPSHQFPLGMVLSMARRLELLSWARRTGAWIVEDDYASEFRYSGRPLASLQGLDDGERVIYAGTFNKVLFPGLRIGYAVVPRSLARAFVTARHLIDRHPPSLLQTLVADFMRQGYFSAHLRRMRLLYRDARDVLVAELTRQLGRSVTVAAPDEGMNVVAYLRDGLSDVEIEDAARRSGVVVRAISRLYHEARPRSGLMLGFTGYPHEVLTAGVTRLARVVPRR